MVEITAPPSIINLDVVETDTRQTPAMIHLRWQSPRPPLNGKLYYYKIQSCLKRKKRSCFIVDVQLNEICDLWDDYICRSIKKLSTNAEIQVRNFLYNIFRKYN